MSGSQIAQVISNLVRNAVQAMQASEREQILWFRTKIQGSTAIVFELEDTGTGIDPAQLEEHIRRVRDDEGRRNGTRAGYLSRGSRASRRAVASLVRWSIRRPFPNYLALYLRWLRLAVGRLQCPLLAQSGHLSAGHVRQREAPPKRGNLERIYLRTFRLPADSLPLSEIIS
jgi:Histidine kinase-, DNA gyrase B-, and HSP90-like ATPase